MTRSLRLRLSLHAVCCVPVAQAFTRPHATRPSLPQPTLTAAAISCSGLLYCTVLYCTAQRNEACANSQDASEKLGEAKVGARADHSSGFHNNFLIQEIDQRFRPAAGVPHES